MSGDRAFEPTSGLPLWVEVVLSLERVGFILSQALKTSLVHDEILCFPTVSIVYYFIVLYSEIKNTLLGKDFIDIPM